jgi:hypothetical protein
LFKTGSFFALIIILIGCGLSDHTKNDLLSIENQHAPGQGIYREGVLPSGEAFPVLVQGDIPVDSRLFTCESCHRRSGLGTTESFIVIPPINGNNLFRSRQLWDQWRRHSDPGSTESGHRKVPSFFLGKDLRPAYTEESLAKVIRTGIDPSGRELDFAMPRYDLNEQDMPVLIRYLKGLSPELSPGVTEETLHFATIVSDGVSPEKKEAMLSVLRSHIRDRNTHTTRNLQKRARKGAFIKRDMDAAYRDLTLDVWELKGPRETWQDQLASYYSKKPVFALLGGIAEGDWTPIHEFCEQYRIPCIFPITDQPVISNTDWNTLYFSKGLYQEGETAASYLRRTNKFDKDVEIVQVYRSGSRGALAARGFQEKWKKFGRPPPENLVLSPDEAITDKFVKKLTMPQMKRIILLWVETGDIADIEKLTGNSFMPEMIFISSGLIGENLSSISYRWRDSVYITYPYSFPQDKVKNINFLKTWLKIKKIPVTDINIQSKMYFLGWMLTESLMAMRSEFYRDYFLESFEMMTDQSHSITVYPRLSFGAGQRYASKGCYIVQLGKGASPALIQKSEWVIH